jgi:hypothetical protein
MSDQAEITVVNPDDPALTVKLEAQPPVIREASYGKVRGDWNLDMLERTLLEFRAAGAWDTAKVELSHKSVTCEVLAHRGADAMPWGWRPSQGPPPPPDRLTPLPNPVVPDTTVRWPRLVGVLGQPVLHGVMLLVVIALLGLVLL